jgi:hypothetical protein
MRYVGVNLQRSKLIYTETHTIAIKTTLRAAFFAYVTHVVLE